MGDYEGITPASNSRCLTYIIDGLEYYIYDRLSEVLRRAKS